MQGGKYQVTTISGADRGLCGNRVANFADHDYVGRLPQNAPQEIGKIDPDCRIDLRLAEALHGVFNRIFNRIDPSATIVQLLQASIKRCGLAGRRWTGDEYQSRGRCDHRQQIIELPTSHAQAFEAP